MNASEWRLRRLREWASGCRIGTFIGFARAVFDSAELSDYSKRVRRVARWLLDKRPTAVSREDIRRRALSMSATAEETESVLQRLHYLGFVQPDIAYRDKPGRPTTHWQVNPALAEPANPVA